MDDLPIDAFPSPETASPEADFARFGQGGDSTALNRALEAVSPLVATAAHQFAVRPEDAEDLVQETYLRAIRSAGRYDPNRSLGGWMYGILRHVADEQRRRRARPTPAIDPGPDRDPALELAARETTRTIQQALRGVPHNYREVLRRRLVDGLGAADIARLMRVPVATVRSKLQRGLRLLRQLLPAGLGVALYAACAPRARAATVRRALRPPIARPLLLAAISLVVIGAATFTFTIAGEQSEAPPTSTQSTEQTATVTLPPTDRPTRDRSIEQSTVTLTGSIDVGEAYRWRDATIRAVALEASVTPVPIAGLALDHDAVARAQQLRRLADGATAARAPISSDGSFELTLPAGHYVLDLVDVECALLVPRVIAVAPTSTQRRAPDRRRSLGVLLGYRGQALRGRVPPDRGIDQVTLWTPPVIEDPFSTTTISQACCRAQLTAPVNEDDEFTIPAAWRDCSGFLVAEGPAERWFAEVRTSVRPVETMRCGPLQRATRSLTVHVEDVTTGELRIVHESGFEAVFAFENGTTTATGLLPGTLSVRCATANGSPLQQDVAAHLDTIWLRQPTQPPLRGRVIDTTDTPVAGANILSIGPGFDPTGQVPPERVTTDADGNFAVRALTGRSAILAIDAGHGRRQQLTFEGRDPITVRVPHTRALVGRLIDHEARNAATGTANFLIAARLASAATANSLLPLATTHWLGPEGRFEIADVPTDCQELQLVIPGFAAGIITVPTKPTGRDTVDLGDVRLESYPTVHGRVVDKAGQPVANAIVASRVDGMGHARSLLSGLRRTDADGNFEFPLPAVPGLELVAWSHDHLTRGSLPMPRDSNRAILLRMSEIRGQASPGTHPEPTNGCKSDERIQRAMRADGLCRLTITVPPEFCTRGAELLLATDNRGFDPIVRAAAARVEIELERGQWDLSIAVAGEVLSVSRHLVLDHPGDEFAVALHPETTRITGQVRGNVASAPALVILLPTDSNTGHVITALRPDGSFEQPGVDPEHTNVLVLGGSPDRPLCAKGSGRDGTFDLVRPGRVQWDASHATDEPVVSRLDRIDEQRLHMPLAIERDGSFRSVTVPPGRLQLRIAGTLHQVTVGAGESIDLKVR